MALIFYQIIKSYPFRMPNGSDRIERKAKHKGFIDKGIIQLCISRWGAPKLFVNMMYGTFKMFIHYLQLKEIIMKNKYPLPRIENLFDQLEGTRYLSKIDLKLGYQKHGVRKVDILITSSD